MKYKSSEIFKSIFLCTIVLTILDSYLNLDKVNTYCCCNIEKTHKSFEYFSLNSSEIFLKNAFCVFDENDTKFIVFQSFIKDIINKYNNYTFPLKFISYQNNNNYCNYIYNWNTNKSINKNFWKNKTSLSKDFWNEKCYSITHERINQL